MPTRELDPYVINRPRIEARRAIDRAEQIAVGFGRLKPEDHKATLARWRRDMDAGQVARPTDPSAIAAAAQGAGIGMRIVSVRRGKAPKR